MHFANYAALVAVLFTIL